MSAPIIINVHGGYEIDHDELGCEDPALDSAPATRRDLMRVMQRLEGLIAVGHEAEMQLIDDETNEIGKQLEDLAASMPNTEQAERLRAHAARLNGMGKTTTTSET